VARESIDVAAVRRGIDSKHRGVLWKLFCGVPQKIATHPGYFQQFLDENVSRTSPAIFQIDKDVPRTFPHISDVKYTEVCIIWKKEMYCVDLTFAGGYVEHSAGVDRIFVEGA
jgi:hypothetical protein